MFLQVRVRVCAKEELFFREGGIGLARVGLGKKSMGCGRVPPYFLTRVTPLTVRHVFPSEDTTVQGQLPGGQFSKSITS